MRKIIISTIVSFISLASFAQVQRDAPLPGVAQSDSTSTSNKQSFWQQMQALDLTKDQRVQLRQIRQTNKATRETILSNDSLTEDQKKMQLKELRKETVKNIHAILTDDQWGKLKAMRAERADSKNNDKNDPQETQAMEEEILSLPAN
ncbi:MAG TPA: hypothetical protein VK718_11915 [Ferruginibacter sp.]|jgi:Spy/CpxP family protein refolding chaperone|nr:hypothetical protein [Ferruginibacter sp.]